MIQTFAMLIDHEREEDGRWIASVPMLGGVAAYGGDQAQASRKAVVLALRRLAEDIEADRITVDAATCVGSWFVPRETAQSVPEMAAMMDGAGI